MKNMDGIKNFCHKKIKKSFPIKVQNKGSNSIFSNKIVIWLGVGLFYLLFLTLITWPLIFNLNSKIIGFGNDGGDGFLFLWDVWWVKKSFISGLDIFKTNYIFWPNGVSLFFHTLILGQAILSLPFLFLPLVFVFNVSMFLGWWLTGIFSFWLAKILWKKNIGAFFSGLIVVSCPYLSAHALGHFNLIAVWPFVLLLVSLVLMENKKKVYWSILSSFCLLFLLLNDLQYFVFGLLLGFMYLFLRLLLNRKIFIRGVFVGSLFLFIMAFPLVWRAWQTIQVYMPKSLLGEINYWSADLTWLFFPSYLHPIWRSLSGSKDLFEQAWSGSEASVYLGWLVVIFFLISFFLKRRKKDNNELFIWQIMGLFFLILALGPILKIGGKYSFFWNDVSYTVLMPYWWLYKIPVFQVARVPARFYILAIICLAIVFAFAVNKLFDLLRKYNVKIKYLVIVLLVAILISEYWSWPLRMQTTIIPKVYEKIKEDKDDVAVLELPLWWRDGHVTVGDSKTIIQYYQTYHEKKILNGVVSRVPQGLMEYYGGLPGVKYLMDISQNYPDDFDMSKEYVLYTWRYDLNIKYIVIHQKYFSNEQIGEIKEYIEKVLGLEKWYQDETEIAYRIF